MPITPEVIHAKIQAVLPDAEIAVRDSTGTSDHFDATVISASFEGKGLVDRHRMIYGALGVSMQSDIHALALVTLTPAERTQRAAPRG